MRVILIKRSRKDNVMEMEQIVEAAKAYAVKMFGDDAASEPRLEEIIPVNDALWDITLSFRRKAPLAAGGLAINLAPHLVNYYKIVRIHGNDGKLVQIKDVDMTA
jgi:hypothetical protein